MKVTSSFELSTSTQVDEILDFLKSFSITSEMIELVAVIGMGPLGPPFESHFSVSFISLRSFSLAYSLENKELSHVGPTLKVGDNSNLHIVGTALVDSGGAMESINARIL